MAHLRLAPLSCFSFFLIFIFAKKDDSSFSVFLFFSFKCFIAGNCIRVQQNMFPPWSVLHGDVVS